MPAPVEQRRFLGLDQKPLALAGAEGGVVATGAEVPQARRLAA